VGPEKRPANQAATAGWKSENEVTDKDVVDTERTDS
jgi:hypothetical protein